jgi:peptidoglycan hydrolase FlgJ
MTTTMPLISQMPVTPSAATTYTDINGLAALKKDPSAPQSISAVAQQVEALFLQMMLKSMRDANIGGEPDSNETSMYQDMFDKQVALTISQHQDLGLGALLKRQISGSTSPTALPGTSKATGAAAPATTSTTAPSPSQFVNQVLPTIQRAAAALGVNPLGLLAQAALETGWGQRMPRTADGHPSLNLFGIKAGNEWAGARATASTVEFNNGVATQRRAAFRAYGSIDESVSDFANLLKNSPRYRDAIAAGSKPEAYIESIGKSGYASDPEYANKLNQVLNSDTLRTALSARTAAL